MHMDIPLTEYTSLGKVWHSKTHTTRDTEQTQLMRILQASRTEQLHMAPHERFAKSRLSLNLMR